MPPTLSFAPVDTRPSGFSASSVSPTSPTSLGAIKARQQQMWASGDFSLVASRIASAAERMVEAADLEAGWRVLDVATGSGNAAIAAARCGCEVVGVDYVPALLEHGRIRAAAEGLEVEFVEGDAEALPFPSASFDAVLSIYGAMFAPDAERTAEELLRVTRPGGRIAMGNWTPDGFIGAMLQTVGRHVAPAAGLLPPTQWGTEARLRELFGAGIVRLMIRRREFIFRFRSANEFVDFFRRHYGPTLKAFEAVGPAGAAALHGDLAALAARWNRNGGAPLAIPGAYLEVVADRA
jgi:ubiquinone/menaquinone biosynthesis C-methylase UbiE